MRFALGEDREALRSTARDLLAELCPPAAVRAAWTAVPDPAPWQALAEAGALALLVPESDGGLGLDETYLVSVLEEAGRAALPHPLTETALVAAPLGVAGPMVATDLATAGPTVATDLSTASTAVATDLGTTGTAAATNPGVTGPMLATDLGTTGAVVATDLGTTGAVVATDLGTTGTAAAIDPGASGAVVAAAGFAEAFLLVSGRGLQLYEAHEVDVEPVETVDASRHCGRVRPRGEGRPVTEDPAAVAAAFDRGALGAAAELLGLSRAMLALTVDYASQRHQFGKPIGSFQAVKHHLANARLEIEFAAPAVLYAAHAVARGQPDAARAVSQAKWLAGAAAAVTGRAALQCHGAIGYTTEHDLHLYLKRSWALARTWGGADFHADRVAASIGL